MFPSWQLRASTCMLLYGKLKAVVLNFLGDAVDRNPPAIAGKQVQPLAGENSTHLGQLSPCAPAPVGLCSTTDRGHSTEKPAPRTEATPQKSPCPARRRLHGEALAPHGGHSRRSPRSATREEPPLAVTREEPAQQEDADGHE